MDAAEFERLKTLFEAQSDIKLTNNDPFSVGMFFQYAIASNLSDILAQFSTTTNGQTGIVTKIADISTHLTNIEAKLDTLNNKLTNIDQAIRLP